MCEVLAGKDKDVCTAKVTKDTKVSDNKYVQFIEGTDGGELETIEKIRSC